MVEPHHGAEGLVLQADELHYAVVDTRAIELPDDSRVVVFENTPGPNEVGIQDSDASSSPEYRTLTPTLASSARRKRMR
ncbi:hypothetical protein MWU75_10725 [Ornithinimicrobium sp. F0845]|nr:hypothetical protein [Ornithinimicrobium sp. F0845]